MWKWSLYRHVQVDLLVIVLFGMGACALIYGIDFVYQKIKKKAK